MTDDEIWAARRERARRWARSGGGDVRGYPALSAEEESEESLHAEPPEHHQKKSKADRESAA